MIALHNVHASSLISGFVLRVQSALILTWCSVFAISIMVINEVRYIQCVAKFAELIKNASEESLLLTFSFRIAKVRFKDC